MPIECPNCGNWNDECAPCCIRCGTRLCIIPPPICSICCGTRRETCPRCRGKGVIEFDIFGFETEKGGAWVARREECPKCHGERVIPCRNCVGKRFIQ